MAVSHILYLTPQIILPFSPLSPQEFDRIRHQAEATWQKQTRWLESAMTTYGGSYRTKPLDPSVYNRQYLAEFDQPNYSLESRRAGAQETAKAEGRFPQITSSSQTPFEVKHKVAHQILYGDYHSAHEKEKSHPKMKRSVTYSLVSPCHQGTDVSLRRINCLADTTYWFI
ncbi:uncharacterized protein C4orf51 homolog isoform X2 [Erinaceus europaeus]|uniref:Uncharacterized protein C4orf51 homolog isoform X2 n=1 Tax=Erinaceus europaeus TaxID=9365 RepID=A0ABM3WEK7_ERIEU|nr:uncharacterized protein C4orf51 homolog isoform X2 [Erinaceus europaeus]